MLNKIAPITVSAMLAVGLVACAEEPTCEKVAGHVLKVVSDEMTKQLENLPEEMRQQAKEAMAKNLTEAKFVEECKKSNPGKEELACALKAKTMEEMAKCGALSGPPAAEKPAAEKPAEPAAEEPAAEKPVEGEAAEGEAAEAAEAAEGEAAEAAEGEGADGEAAEGAEAE